MEISKRHILFGISSIASLFAFISICVSVGFSNTSLMFLNGIFFIVYFLSLWNTSTDTFELYDKKYFIVDMLSIAVYVNVPRIFIADLSINHFFICYWLLFALNEAICIGWDFISHTKAGNDKAKNFHAIWTILTFLGIVLILISISFVYYTNLSQEYLVILNVVNICYQFLLLLSWWISQHYIERKNNRQ